MPQAEAAPTFMGRLAQLQSECAANGVEQNSQEYRDAAISLLAGFPVRAAALFQGPGGLAKLTATCTLRRSEAGCMALLGVAVRDATA